VDNDCSSGSSAQCDGVLLSHGELAICIFGCGRDICHNFCNICENGHLQPSIEAGRIDRYPCVSADAEDGRKESTIDANADGKELELTTVASGNDVSGVRVNYAALNLHDDI
jgi:hypothetical protein